MTVNSSANSVILILFAFSDNLSAENSKSSADFCIQRIQLLECILYAPNRKLNLHLFCAVALLHVQSNSLKYVCAVNNLFNMN